MKIKCYIDFSLSISTVSKLWPNYLASIENEWLLLSLWKPTQHWFVRVSQKHQFHMFVRGQHQHLWRLHVHQARTRLKLQHLCGAVPGTNYCASLIWILICCWLFFLSWTLSISMESWETLLVKTEGKKAMSMSASSMPALTKSSASFSNKLTFSLFSLFLLI